ncbi:MAG: class I SAM-dependent methyltransferase, partial [Candidatus Hermodarchaeota archaeon]
IRNYASYSPAKIPFFKLFRLGNQKIHFIRNDSHKASTVRKIKKILKQNRVDLLFIDGDHSYDGVKKDFENYFSLVKKDGIIAFHDIVEHPPNSNCKVFDFWNEIKGNYEYKEIISKDNEQWAGIGFIKNSIH